MPEEFPISCPIPLKDYPIVTIGHGGGGGLTNDLIAKMFEPAFRNPDMDTRSDGAVLDLEGFDRLAFSTDSHVVSPLFFPGGDIGKLSVCGTVNDLVMCGASPDYLSVGFILEEGFPMESLWRIIQSMKQTAEEIGCRIVTGDTKVVEKGKGDGIYINTSGIGRVAHSLEIGPSSIAEGDVVILSGDVGRHGMAVMSKREGLEFEAELESDCAPLHSVVQSLLEGGVRIHCMRDLTRGGLATALAELSESSSLNLEIDERSVPVSETVRGASEILGLDPLYVANEGRFVLIVPDEEVDLALSIMHGHEVSANACRIGSAQASSESPLALATSGFGTKRVLARLSGEQLPRIC